MPIQRAAIDRLRRLGHGADEADVLTQVIAAFYRDAEQWRGDLRSCVAACDLASLRNIVHTLRGSASVLGAMRLVALCGELEMSAVDGDVGACAAKLPMLEEALEQTLAALARVEQEPSRRKSGRDSISTSQGGD